MLAPTSLSASSPWPFVPAIAQSRGRRAGEEKAAALAALAAEVEQTGLEATDRVARVEVAGVGVVEVCCMQRSPDTTGCHTQHE